MILKRHDRLFSALSKTALVFGMVFYTGACLAANVNVLNLDGPNEGFNDLTVVAAVPGNNATTLGGQRLNAAQAAADAWGSVLTSSIPIVVGMNFDPLSCNASSALLGQAGPNQIFRDFSGAPRAATWYVDGLADSLNGNNLGGTTDISATFNSSIDFNNGCLNGTDWWYGIGSPAESGTIDFFRVLLHEIGHGLGVLSLVDLDTGAEFLNLDDIYGVFLEDHSTGINWASMTNNERLVALTNTGNLHWTGPAVVANSNLLTAGVGGGGHVSMYAPNPAEPGSSVSHWDTTLIPNELMEPFATADADDILTNHLFSDIGWGISGPVDVTGSAGIIPQPPNVYCSNPDLIIAAADSGSDTLNISAIGNAVDIAIQVRALHTRVGDINLSLQHEASGTTVQLATAIGTVNCSGDDIDISLWDGAALVVDDASVCGGGVPAANGLYLSTQALSAFDGLSLAGNWTISVADNFPGGNNGRLLEWCILPISHGECDGRNVVLSGRTVVDAELLVCNAGNLAGDSISIDSGGQLDINISGAAGLSTLSVQNGGELTIRNEAAP